MAGQQSGNASIHTRLLDITLRSDLIAADPDGYDRPYAGEMTSLAADVLLLLLDDRTGKPIPEAAQRERVIAGAVLVDLEAAVRIATDRVYFGEDVQYLHVRVTHTASTGDDVLDRALGRIIRARRIGFHRRPLRAPEVVDKLMWGLRPRLFEQLTAASLVRKEHGVKLGFLRTARWRTLRPEYQAELLDGLRAEVLGKMTPAPRTVALFGLLELAGVAHRLLGLPRYSGDQSTSERSRQLCRNDWRVAAVASAIAEYENNPA